MAEHLLTLADVADRTGFSKEKIRSIVQSGRVEHIRSDGTPNGHIRFTEQQYDALLSVLTVAPTSEPPRVRRRRRW